MTAKAIAPRTNGDQVEAIVGRAKTRLAERAQWAQAHPDEVLVVTLPVLIAWRLSFRYRMNLGDHLLITETSYAVSRVLLKEYREWKTRPARAALKEVA